MYIKISGRAKTGGKYSAPTPRLYTPLVTTHGRASFLIPNIGCLGDVFLYIVNNPGIFCILSNAILRHNAFLLLFQTSHFRKICA